MADYISSNILSQAYIHVEPQKVTTEEARIAFQEHLEKFARERAKFFLYEDVDIQVSFEEGSIKARITILGSIALLIQGIAEYPNFREGILLLQSDAKRLSEYIISEAVYETGSKHNDVIRLESRTGVLGSIHKISNLLTSIKHGANGASDAEAINKKIDLAIKEIKKLSGNLKLEEDRLIAIRGFRSLIQGLPDKPTSPKNKPNDKYSINQYRSKRRELADSIHHLLTLPRLNWDGTVFVGLESMKAIKDSSPERLPHSEEKNDTNKGEGSS